jgi:glycosyltransferase involved in cell wall biosynthesis
MASKGSDQLKILLVVEPGIDGVFRYVEGLAKFLLASRHQVHLAYSDKRGSPALIELVNLIRGNGYECLNLNISNAPEAGDFRALYKLRQMVTRIRPDVIHSNSSKAGILARSLALLGVRSSFFYTPNAYYGQSGASDGRTVFFNQVEKSFGNIGTTINTSNDERSFAIDKLGLRPDRTVLINNPVDASLFLPASIEEKQRVRRVFGIPENALVLGSMGRLSFQKDPQTLYEAFAQIRPKASELYLFHVGRGDLAEEMDKLADRLLIKDRLVRVPYLNRPLEFYAAVDAIILTSRYEGLPLVILEALACNLPIISSTGPGTSDIGSWGLSHCWPSPVGDVPSVQRAIEAWRLDHSAFRPINHREIALKRFSHEVCFGAVLNLYQSRQDRA